MLKMYTINFGGPYKPALPHSVSCRERLQNEIPGLWQQCHWSPLSELPGIATLNHSKMSSTDVVIDDKSWQPWYNIYSNLQKLHNYPHSTQQCTNMEGLVVIILRNGTEPLTLALRAAIKRFKRTEIDVYFWILPLVSKVYVASIRMLRTRL